jgi:hypothetical protein
LSSKTKTFVDPGSALRVRFTGAQFENGLKTLENIAQSAIEMPSSCVCRSCLFDRSADSPLRAERNGASVMELSPIFGDGLKDQAVALWD